MEQFIYLGMAVTNQNHLHEEIKGRLKSANACYHSVQKILSSSFLFRNMKVIQYRELYLCQLFCMGVKLGLTMTEKHRLRMFKNRLLRKIFGPKREVVTREWRQLHNTELDDLYY